MSFQRGKGRKTGDRENLLVFRDTQFYVGAYSLLYRKKTN